MTRNVRFDGLVYIVRNVPNNTRPQELESYQTTEAAERALKIVNDHEEQNGRGPNYWRIDDRRTAKS